MKNLSLLLLMVTAIAFTGCKKDPDKKNTAELVGKWYLKTSTEKEYKNGTLINSETNSGSSSTFFEFRSNGTAVNNRGEEYTYKVSGQTLITREVDSDEDEVVQIKKLDEDELIIYGEETEEEQNNSGGKDTYKYTWEDTYVKK